MAENYISASRSASRPAAPLIGLGSDFPLDAESVGIDHISGVENAVQHLIDIGCTKIVHLSALTSIGRVRAERAAAYERIVRRVGQEPVIVLAENESRPAARSALLARLHGGPAFDGVFALNDDMAIGAYRALRDTSRRVPEDCCVVGCDGIIDGEFLDTPISTVLQPVEDMCRLGWETLKRRLAAPDAPMTHAMLRTTLIVRQSSQRH